MSPFIDKKRKQFVEGKAPDEFPLSADKWRQLVCSGIIHMNSGLTVVNSKPK